MVNQRDIQLYRLSVENADLKQHMIGKMLIYMHLECVFI